MRLRSNYLSYLISVSVVGLCGISSVAANEITTNIDLRYRLESVAQDNALADALASTLRSRILVAAKPAQGWSVVAEVDNVSVIGGDTFNSTANGQANYSVVADPSGTDINQAFVRYTSANGTSYTAGRQRVNQLNQRFIGGVGWRQNEQTFDGYRAQFTPMDTVAVDVGYYHNVNRIFGPDGDAANQKGSYLTALASWAVTADHKVAAFGYDFEFDNWQQRSSRTYGVDYQGASAALSWRLAVATQSSAHGAPEQESHHYHRAELNWQPQTIKFSLGQERLAGNGDSAFQTPLATLHAFSGFADVFLTTPNQGLRDHWLGASTKALGGKWSLAWHDFQSDAGSEDYGTEWDLAGVYQLTPKLKGLVKAAVYNGDQHAVDTNKVWLMLQYSL
ncbi:hypothetical protein PSI9734_01215 [Pseudidiomarina piscicola]|uniref:Alginate export domain-containing protein n=1 Tax=Pseudidiomarina piscicola TaxID=2614830 RepID=A0A6S6WMZ0_9GAMM|nr:alginate export family protein [Pseudidiomarina piscicola]CAB0150776.1 hypothetical protein PSI9734_01215 [Pseudidiomarina piscicola]VZT40279.1 hypothetical protein PSI9734_01215 [Pseudomonas aeruginosa]